MLGIDLMHQVYSKNSLLNMAMAFDRVNWLYLKSMLHKFHFPVATINLLMKCVTTTTIAIHYNDSKTPYFKPSRGLYQEDPLYPLLFVLCMEGFSAIINNIFLHGDWKQIALR